MAEMDKAAGQSAPAGAPIANAGIAAATAKGVGKAPIANAPSSVPADDVPEGAVVQKEDAPEDFKPLKAIGEGASALGELIKNNPLEALSVGLMFVPGIGWGMAGYRAAKAINYAVKAKKAYDTGKKGIAAVGQAGVRGVKGAVSRPPKLPTRNAKGQITKQGEAGRQYSKGRTAAVGAGIYGAGKLANVLSDDEKGINSVGLTDAQSATLQGVEEEVADKPFSMMDNLKPRVEQSYAQKIAAAGNIEAPDRSGISSTIASDAQPQELKDQLNKQLSPDIPAAQKIAMEGSDTNLRRDENRAEFNKGIASREAFAKRQLDPKKLRKERLMANLIGGGQRGLLGVAMGGQQADAQAAKFENSQRGKVVKMIQDRQKNDIDVAKIGEANARNVYSTLHAKSDAAMNALVSVNQADIEAADRAAAEFITRYEQEINVKFKEIDAKYKDKILEAQNIADQGKRLATLLTLYTEIQKSISEGLNLDPRYSSGAETAAKIQADPNYKFDDIEEKDNLAYYEGILARSTETQKSFDIVQKAIKKISGINTTEASFNDD